MARSRDLRVTISGDARGLSRGVKTAENDLVRLNRVGVSSTRGISTAFRAAGSVIAGAAIADQIRQTVVAAQESEVAQKQLAAQLKASGLSYRAHAGEIDKAIQKTSQLAGLDDEDLSRAFTNIIRVTGNVDKSLRLTGLAADFARAKHMDVAKAGEIVGKVAGGNTGILSRYGITIQKGATATQALGALQRKFAGQAEAYGKTSAGAQDRFRVAVENLRESVGKKLLPVLTRLTNKAADFVNQMQSGTGAGGRFAAKLKDIADKVRPIAKFFGDHPRLIAIAVGAWVAYRIAAVAATAAARLKLIGMFTGLGPRAAVGGAVAGRSFGTAASTAASGRLKGFGWKGVGRFIGVAMAATIGLELGKAVAKAMDDLGIPHVNVPGLTPLANAILGKGDPPGTVRVPRPKPSPNRQPIEGDPTQGLPKLTKRPPRPIGQNAPGGKPRAKASTARASSMGNSRTTARASSVTAHASANSGIVALGRQLQSEGYTVGEHPAFGGVAPVHAPNSYHYRAMAIDVNGGPGGEPGSLDALHARLVGKPGVVELLWRVTGHYDHLHVAVSGSTNPLAGSRAGGRGGEGVTASTRVAPRRVRKPTVLSAKLGGTLARRPGNMGRKVGPRVPGVERGGFVANPTQGQVELLSSNNPVMRQFQIASRINEIDRLLKSGRVRGADADALIEERRGLVGDLSDLTSPGDAPTPMDFAQAALAEASLTPGLDDDLAAATDIEGKAFLALESARASGDPRQIVEAVGALGAARTTVNDIKSQMNATTDNTDAIKEHTEALKDLKKSIDEQNKFAASVAGTSSAVAQRALADMISGQLGSRVGQRNASPGFAGVRARY